jgi:hypothetical protein
VSLESAKAARSRLTISLARRNAIVVIGPPCAGKTTYVATHATPGDLIVDFDLIAQALGSGRTHEHDPQFMAVAQASRQSAVAAALGTAARVWVVLTYRRQIGPLGLSEATVVVMDTPIDECVRRAVTNRRSKHTLQVIRAWTDDN